MDTMRWSEEENCLELLDQTRLPAETVYLKCRDYRDVAAAIKRLAVRGAPAIGAAAAYGLLLAALSAAGRRKEEFLERVRGAAAELAATQPTAVNLRWALDRLLARLEEEASADVDAMIDVIYREARAIFDEDLEGNRSMGRYGQELIPDGARILTHCNAGSLATAGFGTALGVIRAARDAGKKVSVYAGETRPLLQGARLTTWEMIRENIPVTLITDNMAGYLMAMGKVDLVIVGADRIAANGDAANKIGTYGLAVLAGEHGLPFYVAAPFSTVDFNLAAGAAIPIEERDHTEVTHLAGRAVAPGGVRVWNPAFDVTPHRLITAIITERGVARPPYAMSLRELFLKNRGPGAAGSAPETPAK
ncbi:MAG: S-methyl-5-thioribose-1-phosphate isomerase [Firmicutes bacterium]|nr:S-methyl-5-thioribose-1-phosphate isomerase [Bacillota bacterium]